jgi:tetratricopeptide (TPR) repeat protein
MLQFFPNGDTNQEPQVSKASDKSWILNAVGMCLMNLGRLATAVPFFERKVAKNIELEQWKAASTGYQNLAELNAHLGRLAASASAAKEALTLARRAENKKGEQWSLEWLAWGKHLLGESDEANEMYHQVEKMQRERDSSKEYLFSLDGIHHAEQLRRMGQAAYARRVTAANLTICEQYRWPDDTSRCHRVLGELDADEGNHSIARDHFDTALTIARSISYRAVLIEALLARGRWAAKLAYLDPKGFVDPKGI